MIDWRPISTAPKNGTLILGYGKWAGECRGPTRDDTMCVIEWIGGQTDYPGYEWAVHNVDMYMEWMRPTHWAPMPEPPR